jgi:hypothetical protein
MKNSLLVFLLFLNPLIAFADINECKTDVYFANGILTEDKDAEKRSKLLRTSIIEMLGEEAFTQKIGKVNYVYNSTNYFGLHDLGEALRQKLDLNTFYDFIGDVHGRDLQLQIDAYNASIDAGHKVLVVAHSQGNLFTYEAYNGISAKAKKNFEAVSVASPMSADIKYGTTRIDWDNDIVPRIATAGGSLPDMTSSNARNVSWKSNNVFGTGKPNSDYVVKSNLNQTYNKNGYSYTAKENGLNSKVHAFTFYMGESLKEADGDTEILDPFPQN